MSGAKLWAITTYFNPTKSKLMLDNYRLFRANLGLDLLTIELSFDGSFELSKTDATAIHQIKGNHLNLLWQKERLINIGLKLLPDSCEFVAWLDCDLIFENQNWIREAERILEKTAIIQLFDSVLYLQNGEQSTTGSYKVPGSVFNTMATDPVLYPSVRGEQMETPGNPGIAWAAQRAVLESVELYDVAPIGGGDTLIFSAMFPDVFIVRNRITIDEKHWLHYHDWSVRFNQKVKNNVSWLEGSILHLWHGDLIKRQYVERNKILQKHLFDLFVDIELDDNSCWQWASCKPKMHNEIKQYFFSRLG